MMPRILLIVPPCIELYSGLRWIMPRHNPLGLAYLAGYLTQRRVAVEIFDAFVESASMDDVKKRIQSADAEIVGITSVTATIREAGEIAAIAKAVGKTVVIGGVHVSSQPKETLTKYQGFDYGIVGEGELAFFELVSGRKIQEIDGLVYRTTENIIVNKKRQLVEDLASLPHPARNLLKNEMYGASDKFLVRNGLFFNIITSRGCPYQCDFCASKVIWGSRVRFRPVEDVIQELGELKQMGMTQLQVNDDTFTLREERVRAIAEEIRSLGVEWGCNSRVDTLTPEIAKILGRCGCRFLEFGLESGNQEILDRVKKKITLDQMRNAMKLAKNYGIKTSCSFIIGNIGETSKTVSDTIRLARELNPDFVFFNMLTPYPGTDVYDVARANGWLIKDCDHYTNPKYSDPVISLPTMTAKEIKAHCKYAYRSFYLNPRYILKTIINSLTSLDEARKNFCFLKSFINLVR